VKHRGGGGRRQGDLRLPEHAATRRDDPLEQGRHLGDAQREVRESRSVHRAGRPIVRGVQRFEVQQLEAEPIPLEVDRVERRVGELEEARGRLARKVEPRSLMEPEQIAVEAQRGVEVGDAQPEVGDPFDTHGAPA